MLTNLLTEKIKIYLRVILILITIATLGYVFYLRNEVQDLSKQISNLETKGILDRRIYEYELDFAKRTIDKQSKAIEELEFDRVAYDEHINTFEKQIIADTIKEQEGIKKELEKDSSSENQLRIIQVLMEDFSANN